MSRRRAKGQTGSERVVKFSLVGEADIHAILLNRKALFSCYPMGFDNEVKLGLGTGFVNRQLAAVDENIRLLIKKVNKFYHSSEDLPPDEIFSQIETQLHGAIGGLLRDIEANNIKKRNAFLGSQDIFIPMFNKLKRRRELIKRLMTERGDLIKLPAIGGTEKSDGSLVEQNIITQHLLSDIIVCKSSLEDDRLVKHNSSAADDFWSGCQRFKKSDGVVVAMTVGTFFYYAIKLGVIAGVSLSTCGIALGAFAGSVIVWQLIKYPVKRLFARIATFFTGTDYDWGKKISHKMKREKKIVVLEAASQAAQEINQGLRDRVIKKEEEIVVLMRALKKEEEISQGFRDCVKSTQSVDSKLRNSQVPELHLERYGEINRALGEAKAESNFSSARVNSLKIANAALTIEVDNLSAKNVTLTNKCERYGRYKEKYKTLKAKGIPSVEGENHQAPSHPLRTLNV